MGSVPIKNLTVTKGEEYLTLYQWNTLIAKHYFCKVCGVYTHHQRRSVPGEFAFNIACISGLDSAANLIIETVDGASNSVVGESGA